MGQWTLYWNPALTYYVKPVSGRSENFSLTLHWLITSNLWAAGLKILLTYCYRTQRWSITTESRNCTAPIPMPCFYGCERPAHSHNQLLYFQYTPSNSIYIANTKVNLPPHRHREISTLIVGMRKSLAGMETGTLWVVPRKPQGIYERCPTRGPISYNQSQPLRK